MKKRGVIVAGAIAAAMGLGSAAANAAVTIDPNGAAPSIDGGGLGTFNDPFTVDQLDWAPGNAIAQGSVSAIGQGVGSEFNLFYQARLAAFVDTGGNSPQTTLNSGGPAAIEWTIVAGFRERVTSATANSAEFELVKDHELNFLEIYFDATPDANNLAGTGFSDGRLILRASVEDIGNSNFTITGLDPENLDQSGDGNQYPGVLTVQGEGSSTPISSRVIEVDPTFFSGDTDNLSLVVDLLFQNVSQNLPFLTVNPSAAFTTTAYAGSIGSESGDRANPLVGVGSVGAVNGLTGPDVMFQVDSNSRFQSTVIPEPATAGLGLMGLAALAMGLRRRRMA